MAVGLVQARRLLRRLDPEAVVALAAIRRCRTMLAAAQLGFPTVIHEQNAVLGRANRLLARRVGRIATGFAEPPVWRPADRARAVHTGNPVRPAIRAVAQITYRPPQAGAPPGEPVELLILGGSQGARYSPTSCRRPWRRCRRRARRAAGQPAGRPEDCARVAAQLEAAGIAAEVSSFFADVPERLARDPAGDLPGRGIDHIGARRRRPAGVPGALSARDRRSPGVNARAFAAPAPAGWFRNRC